MVNLERLINFYLIPFGLKVLIVILMWIIGSMVIKILTKIVQRIFISHKLDYTLTNYALSIFHVILRILLVLGILGLCDVATTSFAAIIGAISVAIGMAWSGLLSNFAAGIILIILRPFKVGDYVTVIGQTGTVTGIDLIVTKIVTDNKLHVIIANNKLFSDIIINYNIHPTRRVDLCCQIAHGVNLNIAIDRLIKCTARIQNVLNTPPVTVTIQEFNTMGTLLAVRLNCPTLAFSQVYNDTNLAIAETYAEAGWPIPAIYQVNIGYFSLLSSI